MVGALAAQQAGNLGIGFSGAGFLIPFFLGVIDVLQRQGVLQPGMPVAGGSAGALVAWVANGVIPLETMREEVYRLSDFCLKHGNCYGTLQNEVRVSALRMLPPNAAEIANKHGGTNVAVTFPSPRGDAPAVQRLIRNYTDFDDVVKAVEASIYIPFYAGPRLATTFRGMLAYDGSFGGHGPGFLPCPGPENNVTYCIRVSSLPAKMKVAECFGSLMRSGTARDRARWFNVAGKMLQPAYLVAHLESAGAAYAREATSFEPAQTQRMIDAVNQLVTPGEGEADIFPGRRHKLPYSPLYWLTIMMNPGSPEQIDLLYRLGQAEAIAWSEENGFNKQRHRDAVKGVTGRARAAVEEVARRAAAAGA